MGKGLNAILVGITAIVAAMLVMLGIYGIFAGSFPYDSWDAALAAADGVAGYFTFGPGDNSNTVIIAVLAIVLSVTAAVMVTKREDDLLNEAAERLADKYDSNG